MGWIIALIVVLAVLAVLTAVILLPVGIRVRYDGNVLKVWYTIGPARLLYYPESEEKKKKKAEKGSPVKKLLNETIMDKKPQDTLLGEFWSELRSTLDLFWYLRPKLRITRLELKVVTAGHDPFGASMQYGAAWAAVGALFPLLEEAFVIKKRDVQVLCDYEASQSVVTARLDLRIPLGRLIAQLVRYSLGNLQEREI